MQQQPLLCIQPTQKQALAPRVPAGLTAAYPPRLSPLASAPLPSVPSQGHLPPLPPTMPLAFHSTLLCIFYSYHQSLQLYGAGASFPLPSALVTQLFVSSGRSPLSVMPPLSYFQSANSKTERPPANVGKQKTGAAPCNLEGFRELSPYPEDFVMSSLLTHPEDSGRLESSAHLTETQSCV